MVECLDYQIPVTQLKGKKGNGDMQAAKRDSLDLRRALYWGTTGLYIHQLLLKKIFKRL